MKGDARTLEQELAAMTTKLAAAEREAASARSEVASLETEVDAVRAEVAQKTQQLSEAEAMHAAATWGGKEVSTRLEKLQVRGMKYL